MYYTENGIIHEWYAAMSEMTDVSINGIVIDHIVCKISYENLLIAILPTSIWIYSAFF